MLFNYEALFVFALLISSGHSVPIDGNAIDEVPDALLVESGLTDGVLIEGEREVDNVIDLSRMAAFILRNPDNATGEALSRYSPGKDAMNPEELGSYYEGDMLVPKKDERNGLVSQSSRWADAVVPYVISGSFSSHDRSVIDRGMKEYHAKTCIRFKPRSSERDYIAFSSDNSGCWSSVGRIGGMQEVNLQSPGCLLKVGTFLHEVMHALGFLHEQNRYERDTYVDIVWSNIQSSTKTNFDKASSATTNAFGVPYDYGSVMHYSANAFSMNGRPTIIAKQTNSQSLMGQRDGFSMKDLQKLNSMYCYRRPSYAHTERPSQPTYRPTRPHYPQRPNPQRPYPPNNNNNNNNNNHQFPQRPYPPNYNNNNNNNNNNQFPFLSFLGNLVGSLIQGEEGSFNATEEPQIGQPRTIIPSETNA